jgi:hypothetical protein
MAVFVVVRKLGWSLCEGRWNGPLEVVICCHADEMSLTRADLVASLNGKRCPSTHGQMGRCLLSTVFLFRCGVILSRSNFPSKVFTGFYRRHRLDFGGSFHVHIDSFLMYE